jgi:hypothetical protein
LGIDPRARRTPLAPDGRHRRLNALELPVQAGRFGKQCRVVRRMAAQQRLVQVVETLAGLQNERLEAGVVEAQPCPPPRPADQPGALRRRGRSETVGRRRKALVGRSSGSRAARLPRGRAPPRAKQRHDRSLE